MPLSAAERTARSQIGIATRLAREDRKEMTRAATEAQWNRFYNQTDPALSHEQRVRQAQQLRNAHMARMRLAQAKKKRERRAELLAKVEEWARAKDDAAEAEQAAMDELAEFLTTEE